MQTRVFSLFLLVLSIAANADEIPSIETINLWWNYPAEKITIRENSGIYPVTLRNGEKAFLAGVYIEPRGRNDFWQTLLIQPSKNDVTVLEGPFGHDFKIMDLDNDGISEIITESSGSGQGITRGKKAIVQLNSFIPVILREIKYTENSGQCGKQCNRYHSESSTWEFIDFNNDGVLDLKETLRTEEGRKNMEPKVTESIHRYLLKNKEFVPYVK